MNAAGGSSGGASGGGKKIFFGLLPALGSKKSKQLKQQQPQPGPSRISPSQSPSKLPLSGRFERGADFDATEFEFGQTYEHRGNVQGVYYSYLAAEEFNSPYVQSREDFRTSSLSLEFSERDIVMPDRDSRFSFKTLLGPGRCRSHERRGSNRRESLECSGIGGGISTGASASRRCSEVDVEQIRATLFPVEPRECQFQATQELAQLVRDISEQLSISSEESWKQRKREETAPSSSCHADAECANRAVQEFFTSAMTDTGTADQRDSEAGNGAHGLKALTDSQTDEVMVVEEVVSDR